MKPLSEVETGLLVIQTRSKHTVSSLVDNLAQEINGKICLSNFFKENYENVELHLIGPLQTNKARQAFELFDVIQTLDRPKLAILLANVTQERGFCPSLFIQVNTGEEPQKTGVLPKDLDVFIKDCQSMDLRIDGLMCIPPLNEEPALHFSLLRKMQERNNIRFLSMGMSSDYESAIMFGATHVRIGSAIFGERVANF